MKVAVLLGSYLLGSIPFPYLLTKLKTGKDIRFIGSGNVGATNVLRTSGKTLGFLALALDMAKGAAAVLLGERLTMDPVFGAAAGFAAVVGHSFPLFLGFRGGKSVATGSGAFLVLSPLGILSSIGVFAVMLMTFRIVSLSSVAASAAFPLFAWLFGATKGLILWGACSAALIVVRHAPNLKRILQGTERRIGESRNV